MIVNVPVMLHLSDDPATETDSEFCSANLWLIAGTYFNGVWSKFLMGKRGISCFSTFETIIVLDNLSLPVLPLESKL